jgi:hypothetical protein
LQETANEHFQAQLVIHGLKKQIFFLIQINQEISGNHQKILFPPELNDTWFTRNANKELHLEGSKVKKVMFSSKTANYI